MLPNILLATWRQDFPAKRIFFSRNSAVSYSSLVSYMVLNPVKLTIMFNQWSKSILASQISSSLSQIYRRVIFEKKKPIHGTYILTSIFGVRGEDLLLRRGSILILAFNTVYLKALMFPPLFCTHISRSVSLFLFHYSHFYLHTSCFHLFSFELTP